MYGVKLESLAGVNCHQADRIDAVGRPWQMAQSAVFRKKDESANSIKKAQAGCAGAGGLLTAEVEELPQCQALHLASRVTGLIQGLGESEAINNPGGQNFPRIAGGAHPLKKHDHTGQGHLARFDEFRGPVLDEAPLESRNLAFAQPLDDLCDIMQGQLVCWHRGDADQSYDVRVA
ncbi:hypothetical protein SDC9_63972 [bioreactor metagenome]|uniref:Uncharacterized protein n=1 Tax=bioreactor metagenome TaxID=1076179 RepID=A0A644XN13_9ZZZZ